MKIESIIKQLSIGYRQAWCNHTDLEIVFNLEEMENSIKDCADYFIENKEEIDSIASHGSDNWRFRKLQNIGEEIFNQKYGIVL